MTCAATKGKSPAAETGTMALEVTVVSGEEVMLATGCPLGAGAYAVVRTASSAVSTHVDEDSHGDCNGYPYWDEALRVAIPAGTSELFVEICRRRSNGRVETVAAARVPVGDFTVGPPGHLHCLSYRLFDAAGSRPSRRRNGIINITVRRTDVKYTAPPPPPPVKAMNAGASGSGGSCYGAAPAGAAMGYPVGFTADGKACV
ncbi:hypothetical protein E2562_010033 [Oryza meyeriana var. granulata]|uniref:C2 domain-containing protein n=1 Tax=Oryza meyeriana var. granulata TaxID=110450 RepID=A0A6G1EI40_9ORYZ|nr:hypothetical protein E2562_010033 [Oryza meyeriana var. granulata]